MSDPLELKDEAQAALAYAERQAQRYLLELDEAPVLEARDAGIGGQLPEEGDGALAALTELVERGFPAATRSSGPRFFHFVTGGATPAALGADWLASLVDQNSFSWVSSPLGSQLEDVATAWLLDLFELPPSWGGVLTTGATTANLVGLAAARTWWAEQHGVDLDAAGYAGLPPVPIFSTQFVHASAVKALAMLGIGRDSVRVVAADALAGELKRVGGPAIVIGNAGDVNAGLFDPLDAFADLAEEHGAWLHVDGAFGLFARLSPRTAPLAAGIERAHSVISDGHKWLNVPYDCGFAFVRDRGALQRPFGLSGAYLPDDGRPNFGYLGPEMSRRARAIAIWATLRAYGRSGYRAMVERHVELAQRLGRRIEEEPELELLAPVALNIVCFRHRPAGMEEDELDAHNAALGEAVLADGRVFFGTTRFDGKVAFRPAISNWRTTERDVDLIVDVALELGRA